MKAMEKECLYIHSVTPPFLMGHGTFAFQIGLPVNFLFFIKILRFT